jgi:hypothetical protein
MAEENQFFAQPPSDGPTMDNDDAPILLGDPSGSDSGFAMIPDGGDQPAYLGEVDEASPADDAPIIMGAPSMDDHEDGMEDTANDDLALANAEPTPMQKFNAEWQETLLKRKDEENSRKAEFVEASRAFMEDFQKERERKRENKMGKNREDEQAKLEAIEADLENDNSWQRVCKMVELSHDSTSKAQDVKRMRDVMIHLKNEPKLAETLTS